jgi:gamma-glutamylputrescine oxidase
MNHPASLSYWEHKTLLPKADFTVIGSGIVGLSAAIALAQARPHARIQVLERGPLPEGASTRNAGFACFGSVSELLEDLETCTETELLDLVELRYRGLLLLQKNLSVKALGYKALGGYEIFKSSDKAHFEACYDVIPHFNALIQERLGLKNTFSLKINPKQFGFTGVDRIIKNAHEGQLNTGLMMQSLIKKARKFGIHIINGITIKSIEETDQEVILHSDQGWPLQTDRLIVANNGFARQLLPHLEVIPARNQVLVTESVPDLKFNGAFHYDRGYYYFRQIDGRVLLGGGRHLDRQNEQTDDFAQTSLIENALEKLLREVILPQNPDIKITHRWSGILGLGPVKRPIIEYQGQRTVVAVRMGGMGVAIGSWVGARATELLLQ